MSQVTKKPREHQTLRSDGKPLARPSQRMLYPELIRGRIRELGLTEVGVAEAIGLTSSKLSHIFSGKRDVSIHEALSLSQTTDLPFAVVLATIEGGLWFAENLSRGVRRI